MSDTVVRSFLADPFLYSTFSYCAGCNTYPDWTELFWTDTNESLYDFFVKLQNKAKQGLDFFDQPLISKALDDEATLIQNKDEKGLFKLVLQYLDDNVFEKVLSLLPHLGALPEDTILLLKGFCHQNLNNQEEAGNCYQQAIMINPDVLAGIENNRIDETTLIDYHYINKLEKKTDMHMFRGEYEKSMEYVDEILSIAP